MRKKHVSGFTLIEILIAIAIFAITAIIASSVYTSYSMKGKRADGINALLSIALAEERYRSTHTTYGTLNQVWNNVSTSPQGYYTLSISNITATTYTISAQAQGNQVNDAEGSISCSILQLIVNGASTNRTPSACWPS